MKEIKPAAQLLCMHSATSHEPPANAAIESMSQEYSTHCLLNHPSDATQMGYDKAAGKTIILDEMLEDFSPESIKTQIHFYKNFLQKIGRLKSITLAEEDRIDLKIMEDDAHLNLLRLEG